MWAGLGMLLFLSVSLAVSSLLAGSLPLIFTLNRRHMRLLTACGTGILMGTALIVIIPEGVETLYSAGPAGSASAHQSRTLGMSSGQAMWTVGPESQARSLKSRDDFASRGLDDLETIVVRRADVVADAKAVLLSEQSAVEGGHLDPDARADEPAGHADHDHDFEPHAWVGVSIIAGFVLMYLIDKLPKLASAKKHLRPAYISLGRMGFRRGSTSDDDGEEQSAAEPRSADAFKPSSTTTGLVIHAAADGIALGASSASSSQKLSMIIFVALMIHKAPAAFGLTAVLLKQGLSKHHARAHLIVFSLAAPVGALVTWIVAHAIGGSALDSGSKTTFITGLLLLFSGGTFLYVAMHTMQDGAHDHSTEHSNGGNGYADIYQQQQQQAVKEAEGPTLAETLVTVGGMLLPLVTQVGHAH